MATRTINGSAPVVEMVTITPANIREIQFRIIGTAPYMQARFGEKSRQAMAAKMTAGSTVKKGTKRDARDFDRDFEDAQHRSTEGWSGIPAAAFRNACIEACRLVGYQMTRAKMSIFAIHDGLDAIDAMPLVRLDAPPPERSEMVVRNSTGVADIRVRPIWRTWAATVILRYDADQFTASDVANLLQRAGLQVGIGEGRHFSKSSNGLGFGTFAIESAE